MTPDVVGERLRRRIAFPRVFSQCLRRDVLEVAAQLLAQALRRSRARGGRLQRIADGRCRVAGAKSPRLGFDYRASELRGTVAGGVVRALPRQQLEHQHAERIDISRDGDRAAVDLFRRGVLRCQASRAFASQFIVLGRVLEQFRDTEVEQLHVPRLGDEDVRRLEIAVHDQVGMRERDGPAQLQQQSQAGIYVEPARIAPVVNALAQHILEHQVAGTVGREAGALQLRDVGMGEPRQQFAFACEAGVQQCSRRGIGRGGPQQLDRGATLIKAIASAGKPDLAHAAAADHRQQLPRPQPRAAAVARHE